MVKKKKKKEKATESDLKHKSFIVSLERNSEIWNSVT